MPPVSEAQRRAMQVAAHGHSTLGIPKSVGQEYSAADPGGKLPKRSVQEILDDHREKMRRKKPRRRG